MDGILPGDQRCWVQCDQCQRWRNLPGCTKEEYQEVQAMKRWICSMNRWDALRASCEQPEEEVCDTFATTTTTMTITADKKGNILSQQQQMPASIKLAGDTILKSGKEGNGDSGYTTLVSGGKRTLVSGRSIIKGSSSNRRGGRGTKHRTNGNNQLVIKEPLKNNKPNRRRVWEGHPRVQDDNKPGGQKKRIKQRGLKEGITTNKVTAGTEQVKEEEEHDDQSMKLSGITKEHQINDCDDDDQARTNADVNQQMNGHTKKIIRMPSSTTINELADNEQKNINNEQSDCEEEEEEKNGMYNLSCYIYIYYMVCVIEL